MARYPNFQPRGCNSLQLKLFCCLFDLYKSDKISAVAKRRQLQPAMVTKVMTDSPPHDYYLFYPNEIYF